MLLTIFAGCAGVEKKASESTPQHDVKEQAEDSNDSDTIKKLKELNTKSWELVAKNQLATTVKSPQFLARTVEL